MTSVYSHKLHQQSDSVLSDPALLNFHYYACLHFTDSSNFLQFDNSLRNTYFYTSKQKTQFYCQHNQIKAANLLWKQHGQHPNDAPISSINQRDKIILN